MKVQVKLIGVPTSDLSLERCQEIPVDFQGHTLGELSQHLKKEMDSEAKAIYLDKHGEVKFEALISVNGILIWDRDRINLRLKEGDRIELFLPPG